MIFRAIEKHKEVQKVRDEGYTKGLSTGFSKLDEIYTIKKGFPLFIAGSPHHGKSEFVLDLLVNTSNLYGWKHFIYAGEGGEIADVIAELAHKYTMKPLRKKIDEHTSNEYAMSNLEYVEAMEFIDKHFFFLDTDVDFTIEKFYKLAAEAEVKYDVKFDTTLIDPFNDVVEDLQKHGNREDKWLKWALKYVRTDAKKFNRLNIIITHIADIAPQLDKDSGQRFTPIALPSEWAGGRTWHRRAFTMLLIYRPPFFMKRDDGEQVAENETWVINQKAKPKGSGKLGKISLFWNWQKNRFNELNIFSGVNLPIKQESLPVLKQMPNNKNFFEVDKEETPF